MPGGWIDRTLFDRAEFADRAVVVLRDAATRRNVSPSSIVALPARALAEAIVDDLEEQGVDEAAALRSALLPLAWDVVGTAGFQEIFRSAVEQAHRVAVGQHAGSATIELGETLRILTSTAAVSNPGFGGRHRAARQHAVDDAAPVLDRLHRYRTSERVRWLDEAAFALAVVAVGGAIALDRRRRRAVQRIGTAIVGVGLAFAVVSWTAPRAAAHDIVDATLARAVFDATGRFVSDLATLAVTRSMGGHQLLIRATVHGPSLRAESRGPAGAAVTEDVAHQQRVAVAMDLQPGQQGSRAGSTVTPAAPAVSISAAWKTTWSTIGSVLSTAGPVGA